MVKKVKMILTNSFKADIRVFKEAKTLVENGYEVEVLCWDRENEFLNMEIDEKEGIKIKRFYPYSKYGSGKKQVIPFLKFIFKIKSYLKNKEYDIIHAHDLDGLLVAKIVNFFNNKKIIYDSHEFFSGYKTLQIDKKVFLLEKILLSNKDYVITVSETIANNLKKFYNPKEVRVIRNIPYLKKIEVKKNLLREELNISEENKILLYQGCILKGRGIKKILDLVEKLEEKYVAVFIGEGNYKNELVNYALEKNISHRIFFKDFVENKKLINYTNSADIGICTIEKKSLSYYYCLPNKFFEFIQGEIPIIGSNFPDLENLILKYDVGITIDPNKLEKTASVIPKLLEQKEQYLEKIRYCKQELNWECESKKLLELYKNIGGKK